MTDKFGMGALGLGPLPGVTETMDFVRRAWSSFNLPSSMAPTLDVDEIDKRIADLRTVEQWLSLNLGMLQSAIQGLEIQRGTLAALKAFGEAVGSPAGLDPAAAAKAMAAMAGDAMARSGTAAADAAAAGGARTDAAPSDAPAAGAAPRTGGRGPQDDSAATGAPPFAPAGAAAINPAAWWNLLQSQFTQVAQAALAGAAAPAAAAFSGGEAATRRTGEAPQRARKAAGSKASGGAASAGAPAGRKGGNRARRPAG